MTVYRLVRLNVEVGVYEKIEQEATERHIMFPEKLIEQIVEEGSKDLSLIPIKKDPA